MIKSYKDCPSYTKIGKKKARKLPDNMKCQNAVSCRRCRRCPFVPKSKLELWKKEAIENANT